MNGIEEWMNKMWSVHTKEYYLALKKKETLSHAAKRMHLEDIMQIEISQSQ